MPDMPTDAIPGVGSTRTRQREIKPIVRAEAREADPHMEIPEVAEVIPVIPDHIAEMAPTAEGAVLPEREPILPVEAAETIEVPVRHEVAGATAAQDHPEVAAELTEAPDGLHDPRAVIAVAAEAAAVPQEEATAAVEVAVPQGACEAAVAEAVLQEVEVAVVAVAGVAVAEVNRNQ
ncbi:hypothetical protein SAMN04490243_2636 [Robiginitalea myxolifaciens]|uniref:Uncharacterized protein n=1 Tax=Robiginitalea myxolifaciens TaxID=400055 RepID=A0A1I6HEH3_9FLAO|nr:hypothetical protein SAMN04490243_2636 [Robiginitalea myxolifaciens]